MNFDQLPDGAVPVVLQDESGWEASWGWFKRRGSTQSAAIEALVLDIFDIAAARGPAALSGSDRHKAAPRLKLADHGPWWVAALACGAGASFTAGFGWLPGVAGAVTLMAAATIAAR